MQNKSFVCSSCGLEHAGVPLSFAADYPDPYANLSLDDRDARAIAGSNQCIIDQREFYIRGFLELPILEPTISSGGLGQGERRDVR